MWDKFSSFILRRRYFIITIVFILTAFMAYNARTVKMSYEMAQMLPDTDSTLIAFQKFQSQFGQDGSIMVIGIKDPKLFELANFNAWMELSDHLLKVEGIDNVVSMATVFGLKKNSEEKKFEAYPVIKPPVKSQKELDSLLKNIFDLPFYEGFIYSEDRQSTLMALTLDRHLLDSKDRGVLMDDILHQIDLFKEKTGLVVRYSGLPYIRANNTSKVSAEIKLFILLAILITSAILFLFFRSLKAMFFSMVVVLSAVVWAVGIQGLFGYEITILTGLIPPLIIVIGIPNCIFIHNRYHQEYKRHGNKMLGLRRVILKIGNAIFLTNTTTALGFATFIFTDSDILIQFGIVASCGIASAFLISITLLPIILSFQKSPSEKHTKHLERQWVHLVVDKIILIVTSYRKWVFTILFFIVCFAIYGITLIKTTGNLADDLPRHDPVYLDLKFFEDNFKGVLPFEVTVTSLKKGGITKLSSLKKIDKLQSLLSEYPEFSRPLSIVEGLKFAKQGFYGGNPEKYSLYNSQEMSFLGPYLKSADNKNQNLLKSYLDSTNTIARITAQMADVGSNRMEAILGDLRPRVDSIFSLDNFEVVFTGTSVVWLKGTEYLVKNLFVSLGIAIVLIAFIMSTLFASLRMVLVSLVPNILPLLVTASIMGYFGIAIKPSTILIFSIAFGISVDDTIHYLAKYRQELNQHKLNIKEACIKGLRETGVSMIYTSIVLFFGFGVFAASEFGGTVALGLLVSMTLLVAMASNLILLPSLLLTLDNWLTTKAFKEEALIVIVDEDEDIELSELEVKSIKEID